MEWLSRMPTRSFRSSFRAPARSWPSTTPIIPATSRSRRPSGRRSRVCASPCSKRKARDRLPLRHRHRASQLRRLQFRVSSGYSNRKFTSIVAATVTGRPSFLPGANFHFFTASMAFSSRPSPRLRATLIFVAWPLGSTSTYSSTVPWYFAFLAASEYSGSTLYTRLGAVTPPPTRNTPPPTPALSPGPKPPPLPDPTPPPEPEPIPPPRSEERRV